MNIFISQPMVGLTNDELKKYRSKVLDMIQRRYPTEKIHLINPPYPYYLYDYNESVWFLGKSLEYLSQVDLVFFTKNWEKLVVALLNIWYVSITIYQLHTKYEKGVL